MSQDHATPPVDAAQASSPKADGEVSGLKAPLALFTAAGLLAGLIGWAAVRLGVDFDYLPPDAAAIRGVQRPTAEQQAVFDAGGRTQQFRTMTISFAILGAASGGMAGIAAGIARRSGTAAVTRFLAGSVLGGLCGAAGGAGGQFLFDRLRATGLDSILLIMIATAVGFTVMAVGPGLAAGTASRRGGVLIASVAAALVAGLIYPVLAAVIFPTMGSGLSVPRETWPLLMWAVLPSTLIGLAIGRAYKGPVHGARPAPA